MGGEKEPQAASTDARIREEGADEAVPAPGAGDALSSFKSKWGAAHPEFGLALTFVPARRRAPQSAFACLAFELEHAAFATRDAEPAAAKLQWWAEELVRAGRGEARHPLSQALAVHPAFASIASVRWYEVVRGALMQRDPEPAADRSALLDVYAELYRPLAAIESDLFGVDAHARSRVAVASRALRETAAIADTLRAGRLPLPLDLLARHRLARGDLVQASPAQAAAIREWLSMLAVELASVPAKRLGVVAAAQRRADRARARRAARAEEPLSAVGESLGRLPLATVWAAWRAGRRSPP
ncbi:squalene/phytoene synthase family protein [Dokdonella sp.]|uniref:squalene/phytoene synthase family protein n=1 Tax=Dokdonella sp. TaxID=2291710 RepID=UPI00262CFB3B|nr:squalene/phytoene synthase family protein [Dokdonella sp.]